jgi:hypothetical protein
MSGPGATVGTYQSCTSPATYNSLADGSYTFNVRAIDAANNIDASPAARSFTIVPPSDPNPGFPPPAPAISSPQNYSWVKNRAVTITGTAQAGSTVELFDSGSSLGTTVTSAGGSWARTVDLADGAHLVTARATNTSGTSSASPVRVILVDTRAPEPPVITAPAPGSSVPSSFTVRGTAESGVTVELFDNGSSRGTVAASGGEWSRAVYNIPAGTRTYAARAVDLAGNVSAMSASRTVSVGG